MQQSGNTIQELQVKLEKEIAAKRIGKPEEFGAAVAIVASPAASYINGKNLL